MNTTSKIFRPLAALSLIAVGLSGVSTATAETVDLTPSTVSPALADTVDLTPSTTLEWNEGQTSNAQFDPSGRLWVWNTDYSPGLPYGKQVSVFVEDLDGDWFHSYRWKPRKFFPRDMTFASSGTMYATGNCKLATVSFKSNGRVKKMKTVKFKGGFCPLSASLNETGNIVLVDDSYIREYRLPLSSRSRALRTITFSEDYGSENQIHASRDGNVYISHGASSDGVDVYTADQQGMVAPARSFTIHPDYGSSQITDIADGVYSYITLRVNGDILIYDNAITGLNQIPLIEFNLGEDTPEPFLGVAYDGTSTYVAVNYGEIPALKFYAGPG